MSFLIGALTGILITFFSVIAAWMIVMRAIEKTETTQGEIG